MYEYNGYVYVGIWVKKGGAWQYVGQHSVFVSQSFSSGGQRTLFWSMNQTFTFGGGTIQAIGVTIDGYDGNAATISGLNSINWTVQGASGERSATPSGQRSTVTVRP